MHTSSTFCTDPSPNPTIHSSPEPPDRLGRPRKDGLSSTALAVGDCGGGGAKPQLLWQCAKPFSTISTSIASAEAPRAKGILDIEAVRLWRERGCRERRKRA